MKKILLQILRRHIIKKISDKFGDQFVNNALWALDLEKCSNDEYLRIRKKANVPKIRNPPPPPNRYRQQIDQHDK